MLAELVQVRDDEVALRILPRHRNGEHEWLAHHRVEWVAAEPPTPTPTPAPAPAPTPRPDHKRAAAGDPNP